MGFVYLVLVCIGAGVIVCAAAVLFELIRDRSPQINEHFARYGKRYQMLFILAVIIAAAVYMANTTTPDDEIVQTDTRGNPLDDN